MILVRQRVTLTFGRPNKQNYHTASLWFAGKRFHRWVPAYWPAAIPTEFNFGDGPYIRVKFVPDAPICEVQA